MQTFTFTIEQIKEIYNAGIVRGSDEASAYNCGAYTSGKQYDGCVDVIFYIVNDGKKWGEPEYTNYNEVEEWFK